MDEVVYRCVMGGCYLGKDNKPRCQHCGFEEKEAERRKALPLVKDKDGLRRKHVGIKQDEQRA